MIDTAIFNARILTMADDQPFADALAIRQGRFAAVGSAAEILGVINENTEKLDLQGATVTPGLIDTHIHVVSLGSVGAGAGLGFLGSENMLDITHATSPEEILDLIAARAAQAAPGDWVLTSWPSALGNRAPLTRHDLDRAAANVPVMVTGYPYVIVNSHLLKMARIGPDVQAPRGGEVVRDANGDLTGAFAFQAVYQLLPSPPQPTVAETEAAIGRVQAAFLREGLTAYRDVGLRGPAIEAYQNLRSKGELKCRTELTYTWQWSLKHAEMIARALSPTSDEWLGLRSVKLSMDGDIVSRTAWSWNDWFQNMTTPLPGSRGYCKIDPDELVAMVDVLHRAGLQVVCHCEGDRAIDAFVDAVVRAVAATPTRDARHSVIHCNLPSDSAIAKMRELGDNIVVETQSVWLRDCIRAASCGPERSRRFIPLKTLLANGITVGNGCDFPPHDFPPKNGIWSACTRDVDAHTFGEHPYGVEECVSFEQALRTYTINAARCLCREKDLGSIEPGKLADFVVWADPIDRIAPRDLPRARVSATFVNGRAAYRA